MAFKDKLLAAINARGSQNAENLTRIAHLARKVRPDFSLAYLTKLMMGHPPREVDYQALAAALGISPADLIDENVSRNIENSRVVRKFLIDRMDRPDLIHEFTDYLEKSTSFRNQVLTHRDLYVLFRNYLEMNYDEPNDDSN